MKYEKFPQDDSLEEEKDEIFYSTPEYPPSSVTDKRGILIENPPTKGITIGDFVNVRRDGWFYSNSIPQLKAIQIDRILMWIGIRSFLYKDTKGLKPSCAGLYQQFMILFMATMACRWIILTAAEIAPINPIIYACLGDFMDGYGSPYSRFTYKVPILFVVLITFLTQYQMVRWETHPKRNKWLDILSFLSRKQSSSRLAVQACGLPEGLASSIWMKAITNLKGLLPLFVAVLVSGISCVILECRIASDNRTMVNWIWTGLEICWFTFLIMHFTVFTLIFDIFTHYFDVRVQKVSYDMEQIYKYRSEMKITAPSNDRSGVIWSVLKEFNCICVQLNQVDHFWQYYLLPMLQLGPFAIIVGMNNNFVYGTRMKSDFHYWAIWIQSAILLFLWLQFVIRASRVEAQTHRMYRILNRMCLIPVDENMKLRLSHAVKRYDGLHIGFNCFSMFTVGHEYLYHVVMFWGAGYVLLLDAALAQSYAKAVILRRKRRAMERAARAAAAMGSSTTESILVTTMKALVDFT